MQNKIAKQPRKGNERESKTKKHAAKQKKSTKKKWKCQLTSKLIKEKIPTSTILPSSELRAITRETRLWKPLEEEEEGKLQQLGKQKSILMGGKNF